ncbi:CoA ligase [Quillaja saponaria]|uniref:CoA ligase n=1 Tax=Quillaja saponaria TaxID=32244 RepID=A0AAD7KR19_QUISA|nr:CoA ligase [Quillaja saponaria]
MEGLVQCSANYMPLTPISFLQRAAFVYGDKLSIIYGDDVRFSWRETHERCIKLASSFVINLGISYGDIIVVLAPNIPALYELHFGVPMAGAVLTALNTKLDATMLASLLEQLEAKIDQTPSSFAKDLSPSILNYNDLIVMGQADFETIWPSSELDPISVNYTSGSTGIPKGAVYSHRAAYLNSLATIFRFDMNQMPVFLWTVDMFRCNGWCFPWVMAALGGTNVCIRNVSAKIIYDSIYLHKVSHFCGAPKILNTIVEAQVGDLRPLEFSVDITVAGALPPVKVLMHVTELGFNLRHGYGMTEVLGPAIVTPWKPNTESTTPEARNLEDFDVKDPNTMKSVPFDGKTIGEIMFKGNTLMSGYLKNPKVTQEAFRGGWYRTGDLAIRQPDGYIKMKDRAKDIIHYNGEAISTLEVEAVLLSHPKVLETAVVGKLDKYLGEVPCAFVKLKEGCGASAEELIKFCGEWLPNHMVPKSVVFGDLPVNSTGKVQKFILRKKANAINGVVL